MLTNYGELDVVIDEKTGRARRTITNSAVSKNASGMALAGPRNDDQMVTKGNVQGGRYQGKFRSKLELAYARQLEALTFAGEIKDWLHEPVSFTLGNGKRYRPDFMIVYPSGLERRAVYVEVKGHHKNRRDSLTHLAWAAQRYPMFRWILVTRERGQWHEQEVQG